MVVRDRLKDGRARRPRAIRLQRLVDRYTLNSHLETRRIPTPALSPEQFLAFVNAHHMTIRCAREPAEMSPTRRWVGTRESTCSVSTGDGIKMSYTKRFVVGNAIVDLEEGKVMVSRGGALCEK